MKHTEALISVIVPVYRVEAYLPRCVESLLGQTCEVFELILVDDGSPDGCGKLCDGYAVRDPRVRVIHKENGGLSDARNAGLAVARGEYLAFVDSDDWVAPRYLERLLAGLEETGADICECGKVSTAQAAEFSEQRSPAVAWDGVPALGELIRDGEFHQYVWNKLYRAKLLEGLEFPLGKTNEDEFWTYRVFARAGKVARIPDVLYAYFQRDSGIMGSPYSLKRLDVLEAKVQRQRFLESRFPELAPLGKANLLQSVLYNGQMTLGHLTGADREQAKGYLEAIWKAHPPDPRDRRAAGRSGVWLLLAKFSFWGTCRIKNLLKRGL